MKESAFLLRKAGTTPVIKEETWDSNFLGLRVGSFAFDDRTVWDEDALSSWDLVYISVHPNSARVNHLLGERNIQLVDKKTTYLMDLRKAIASPAIMQRTRPYYSSENDAAVIEIGMQSSIYSRFSVDKKFNRDKYLELYRLWMERSIKREMAKEVFVSENENSEITGVITLTEKNGRSDIGILAVDEKFRGQRAGKRLVDTAIQYSIEQGYEELQVVTQGANLPACRFYEACGFSKEKVLNIYHYWSK